MNRTVRLDFVRRCPRCSTRPALCATPGKAYFFGQCSCGFAGPWHRDRGSAERAWNEAADQEYQRLSLAAEGGRLVMAIDPVGPKPWPVVLQAR